MSEQPSAWKPLIDEWIARETLLRPDTPIDPGSVRVRDAVEMQDQAYVLVSYDVEWPWPKEEDAPGEARTANTAVLQAERVRRPWIERDATRSLAQHATRDGRIVVHEHLLGERRAFSGIVDGVASVARLEFADGPAVDATVVDGWFLAIVEDGRRVSAVCIDGGAPNEVARDDLSGMFPDPGFARTGAGADAMYFSPLDLRAVLPLVQWQRSGDVIVVATCVEKYDEGGVLRLRIDGIRTDDDTFVSWPTVTLQRAREEIPVAVCGEYSLADTISLDLGFRPWLPEGTPDLTVRVRGLRGSRGPVDPIELELKISQTG